ncbi:MAG: hypothetical protein ACTSRA_00965 [Promethearchaeota archaeon]|nr:MAG: hypothetical protein [Helarchaeota virus Nidhogg Meg22_1012]URC17348.1 MAG: hypothetical protein [Helarchaeota virus Nidhogg Meg22_1214]
MRDFNEIIFVIVFTLILLIATVELACAFMVLRLPAEYAIVIFLGFFGVVIGLIMMIMVWKENGQG